MADVLGQKRRFAMKLDPALEVITLAALRDLVRGADAEGMADDSRFEIFRPETEMINSPVFLTLNEVR